MSAAAPEVEGSDGAGAGRPVASGVPAWGYLLVGALALWPQAGWFLSRVTAPGEDEPWGWAVALLVAVALTAREARRQPQDAGADLRPAAMLLGLYALAYPALAGLPRAALGILGLGAAAGALVLPRHARLPFLGLVLLSLRLTPTLQLYLGLPLQRLAARLAAALLNAVGYEVTRAGAMLYEGGHQVLVDVPCNGLRLLWSGGLLVFAAAWVLRLGAWRTLAAGALALPALVVGNGVRCAGLFLYETGRLPLGELGHGGLGVVVSAGTLGTILAGCRWLRPRAAGPGEVVVEVVALEGGPAAPQDAVAPVARWPRAAAAYGLACLLAALAPLRGEVTRAPPGAFPGWPGTLHGRGLEPAALTPVEGRQFSRVPGRVAAFDDGARRILLGWVAAPTHRLHPRAACARSAGYAVTPRPTWTDPEGAPWGSLTARQGDHAVVLREQLVDADGRVFTDLHAWYLASFSGLSRGPWWYRAIEEPAAPRGR